MPLVTSCKVACISRNENSPPRSSVRRPALVGAQPKSVLVVTAVTTIRKRDQAMTSTGRGAEPVLHEQLDTWTWSSVMVEMTLLRESSDHSVISAMLARATCCH